MGLVTIQTAGIALFSVSLDKRGKKHYFNMVCVEMLHYFRIWLSIYEPIRLSAHKLLHSCA